MDIYGWCFLKGPMSCDGKSFRKEKKYEEVIFFGQTKRKLRVLDISLGS